MKASAFFAGRGSQGLRLQAPDYRCAICGDAVERTQVVCAGDRDADGPVAEKQVDAEIARRKALGIYR